MPSAAEYSLVRWPFTSLTAQHTWEASQALYRESVSPDRQRQRHFRRQKRARFRKALRRKNIKTTMPTGTGILATVPEADVEAGPEEECQEWEDEKEGKLMETARL